MRLQSGRARRWIILSCCFLATMSSFAQQSTFSAGRYVPRIDERRIIETKWRYTYALHVESNTIIHQADQNYNFFLHFRYDYTYAQYLNGRFSEGAWSLNMNELFYRFKHINKFIIAEIDKKVLVLEFTQPNSKGTFQYHFIRVDSKDAPFIKPPNELPDVNVEAINPNKKRKKLLSINKNRRERKRRKNKSREKPTYISIELIGGGYYGGLDPVIRDYIQIKSSGRLIKEFKSVNSGLQITKKDIPREELEAFAEYVMSQNFFEYDRMYDCQTPICKERKKTKPTPIPLRLAIAYGDKKKVVTISIWGKERNNIQYVEYPAELDRIIDAIQRMAHRLDQS